MEYDVTINLSYLITESMLRVQDELVSKDVTFICICTAHRHRRASGNHKDSLSFRN